MRMVWTLVLAAALCATAAADTISSSVAGVVEGTPVSDSDTTTALNTPILAEVVQPTSFFTPTIGRAAQNIGALGAKGAVAVEGIWADGQARLNTMTATNTLESSAQFDGDHRFTFFITPAQLVLLDFAGAGAGLTGAPTARFDVEITLNGTTTLFEASAELNGGQISHTLTKSGEDLGGTMTSTPPTARIVYDFDPFVRSIALPGLVAGDTVFYTMSVMISAFGFELGAEASIGDPNDFDQLGSTGRLIFEGTAPPPDPDPIPEPGTVLLLGAALAGFAWHRRRRAAE